MEIKINLDNWGRIFAVPSVVVENYMKLADGNMLKVLLYVLCNNDKILTTSDIAESLDIPTNEVEHAFLFWEQVNLFAKQNTNPPPTLHTDTAEQHPPEQYQPHPTKPDDVQPITAPDVNSILTEQAKESAITPALRKQTSSNSFTPKEISDRIINSKEITFLFATAEQMLQHLLTHTEQRSIIWMRDYLGLPTDVILTLIAYCKSIGKSSIRYIEHIAASWQESSILTITAAEKEVNKLKWNYTLSAKIMSAFGINRKLSSNEESFISKWNAKAYDIDLISYAYDKTIDAINKVSFAYINKILLDWDHHGLLNREQVDNALTNKTQISANHSYDLDKFDSLAVNFKPNPNSNKGAD